LIAMAGGLGLNIRDLMEVGKQFDGPIKAETISQVQILTDSEGGDEDVAEQTAQYRDAQLGVLNEINEKLAAVTGGDGSKIEAIRLLLADHLPKISAGAKSGPKTAKPVPAPAAAP
jgi:hypothetical protein